MKINWQKIIIQIIQIIISAIAGGVAGVATAM